MLNQQDLQTVSCKSVIVYIYWNELQTQMRDTRKSGKIRRKQPSRTTSRVRKVRIVLRGLDSDVRTDVMYHKVVRIHKHSAQCIFIMKCDD